LKRRKEGVVGILLSSEQIVALAPDASSVSAGKKLGAAKHWQQLGQNADAIWGDCQGSALYHVVVNLTSMSTKCTCPSRKFPCKHGLGLLLLAASSPQSLPEQIEPPEWVATWLAKSGAAAKRKEQKDAPSSDKAPSEKSLAAQAKRAEERVSSMKKGIEAFELWIDDIIRNGLASVESQSATFWYDQAARLMDAKVPGLARQVRQLAEIPGAYPNWPESLLDRLGKISLLTRAFARLDSLEPALQNDVRTIIGWTIEKQDVISQGTPISDTWIVLGQSREDDEKLVTQRTWLYGIDSQRCYCDLQFAQAAHPVFENAFFVGTQQRMKVIPYPSAFPVRVLVEERVGDTHASQINQLTGPDTIAAYYDWCADALKSQPWLDILPCILMNVVPVCKNNGIQWFVQDSAGMQLPLLGTSYWQLHALAGGTPVTVAGEWNGEQLRVLGVAANQTYHPIM
jgi:SWIM zinc finger